MPNVSDELFVETWQRHRSAAAVRRALGYADVRSVHTRRRKLEESGYILTTKSFDLPALIKALIHVKVKNGVVLVASDAHYWERVTCAHRAFVHCCDDLKPKIVILNGDVFDGPTVSRFSRLGWIEKPPTVAQELEYCKKRLSEIIEASPGAKHLWLLGNHDLRFESALAAAAPQYEGVKGMTLKDHFPDWTPAWAAQINKNTIVKHRWKSGLHAAHNNTKNSGLHMVTSHLHSASVQPWTDLTGTRYGVDTGMLADIGDGNSVHYTENNPVNWRSGFAVLTYHKKQLLMPELVQKWDEAHVQFRGELIEV